MEAKMNIAELLKDCPKGMKIDCTMYEDVYFDYVDEFNIIHCYIQGENYVTSITFNQYGTPNSYIKSKCVIFPKGKTTWEGFFPPCKFKDGDVAISVIGDIHLLRTANSSYCAYRQSFKTLDKTITTAVNVVRLATEEEKAKLFQAIKDNGYKWNAETNTLEKLPKFKVGDVIQDIDSYKVKITEVNIESECYGCELMISQSIGCINFNEQDEYELVPNKFDITTLKPFESKVLVRDSKNEKWGPAYWGFYDKDRANYPYKVIAGIYSCCIPYKGNEYLLGTTDDCDEYYKTWE